MGTVIDATKKKGKVVKLSAFLAAHITKMGQKGESYDAILRKAFGLPDRRDNEQPLKAYYLLPGSPLVAKEATAKGLAEARGEAILQATKRGLKKAVAVILVREVL